MGREEVLLWVERRLLYGLGGGCYRQTNLSIGRLRLQKFRPNEMNPAKLSEINEINEQKYWVLT